MQNYYSIYFRFILTISIIALSLAYFSEYVIGLTPCRMCLYQRYPYFIMIGLCISGIIIIKNYRQIIAWLILFNLITGVGLSATHLAVENEWIRLDLSCTGNINGQVDSIEQFKNLIMEKDNVPCDVISFTFLKVSMAGWNFVFSVLLVVLSSIMLFVFSQKKVSNET